MRTTPGTPLSTEQLAQVSGGFLPSTVLDVVVKVVIAKP